ncbi:DUF5392 family protein [Virgibacillus doumboii]|uniref:DUF5392 family protein n=1 Tax=Virgibacillus doumboii TaxID=2697503 RepID=UPI0013E012D4|nr:DUF5392 family protein [Virgibacillus doumboii]
MNNFMMKDMPAFIEREIEIVTEKLKPQLKKSSRYTLFAMPLITVAFVNLFFSLIQGGWYLNNMPILAIYALMAAVGIALYKESKHVKKEMQQIGMEHFIKRINKSEHMNDYQKKEYISTIKSRPKFGFHTFLNFLTEEDQRKRRMMEN